MLPMLTSCCRARRYTHCTAPQVPGWRFCFTMEKSSCIFQHLPEPSRTFQNLRVPSKPSCLFAQLHFLALKFCEVHALEINVLFVMTVHTFTRYTVHTTYTVEIEAQFSSSAHASPPEGEPRQAWAVAPRAQPAAWSPSCVLSKSWFPCRFCPYRLHDLTSLLRARDARLRGKEANRNRPSSINMSQIPHGIHSRSSGHGGEICSYGGAP